jgi:hypothetical protein
MIGAITMKMSSGDVCEIAGISMATLDRWVAAGWVGLQNAFEGHGRHRTYTLGQCLAVAAGALYRAAGAAPERVAGVVKLLSDLGIERLEAEMERGRTFPLPAVLPGGDWPGLMIEPPCDPSMTSGALALMRRLDLAALYEGVQQKIAQLSRRPANKRGRSRGLASKREPSK